MGLTTWENAPDGKVVKPDVSIAKNYFNALELEDMGRLVNAVLDMAERMAKRHIPMTMEDWANRIDIILEAGGDAVLDNAMMENFFGLMKSELLYLQEWDSVEQFKKELIKYIHYYNNDRIKLRLNGKSPVQYRALFQSKSAS